MKLVTLLLLLVSTTSFSSEEPDCNDYVHFDDSCIVFEVAKTEKMIAKYLSNEKQDKEHLAELLVGLNCDNPITTLDTNNCKTVEVIKAEIEMTQYLLASLERLKSYPEMAKFIDESQQSWLTYRDKHCEAIYQQWISGTIRGVMALQCKLQLTQERSYALWRSYLTYMDSTPAILPEPNH